MPAANQPSGGPEAEDMRPNFMIFMTDDQDKLLGLGTDVYGSDASVTFGMPNTRR